MQVIHLMQKFWKLWLSYGAALFTCVETNQFLHRQIITREKMAP